VTSRPTRRWLNAIPITGRFHIMLAILLLAEAGIVLGCLRVAHQHERVEHGARAGRGRAAVARPLPHSTGRSRRRAARWAPLSANNAVALVAELRKQIDATFALPATPEVASLIDTLRTPAAQYLESVEGYMRNGGGAGGATAWAFADLEPRERPSKRRCVTPCHACAAYFSASKHVCWPKRAVPAR
jgi:hypothetical protein